MCKVNAYWVIKQLKQSNLVSHYKTAELEETFTDTKIEVKELMDTYSAHC